MNTIDSFCTDLTIDVFIFAIHFDERSVAAYENLVKRGVKCNKAVVLDYYGQKEKFADKLRYPNNIEYLRCDPNGNFCNMIIDSEIKKDDCVAFDITCVSTPDLFRLFYILKEILEIQRVQVFYSEPKYYQFFNGLYYESKRKVSEINYRPLTEYFTSASSRNVILVCFLGFEKLISKYIHERNEHSEVLVVNGFPAYYPKIKDISLEHNYELISAIGTDRVRYAQANNPYSVYNTLLSIKKEYYNWVIDICVLGSKPMALGACMFALDNSNYSKISYPFPSASPIIPSETRSIEFSKIWWYSISL